MHNVFKGIVVGFIGFIVYVLFGVVEGFNRAFGEATAIGTAGTFLGFALMVIGPVGYIVVLPIAGWLKRRKNKGGGGSSP